MSLLVDTGSSLTWLQSPLCATPSQCSGKAYKNSDSTTFVNTGVTQTYKYGTGSVSGLVSTDQFALSATPSTAQVANNIKFVHVTNSSSLTNLAADGIIGLAPNVPAGASYTTFLTQFNDQKLLQSNIFSIQLGFNTIQSTLWLGGYPTSLARSLLLSQYSPETL